MVEASPRRLHFIIDDGLSGKWPK